MKRMSITWVAETAVIVPLTHARSEQEARRFETRKSEFGELAAVGKRIVISGHQFLRAEVCAPRGRDRD